MAFRLTRRGAFGAIAASPVAAKQAMEAAAAIPEHSPRGVGVNVVSEGRRPYEAVLFERLRYQLGRRMEDNSDGLWMDLMAAKVDTKKSWSPIFRHHVRLQDARRRRAMTRAWNDVRYGDLMGLLRLARKYGFLSAEEIGPLLKQAKEEALERLDGYDDGSAGGAF